MNPSVSKKGNKSIDGLIAEIMPTVNFVITYIVSAMGDKDFSKVLEDNDSFKNISKQVNTAIYAALSANGGSIPIIDNFRSMISVNG